MAIHTLGRVGIVSREAYSPSTTYIALDLVTYQNTSYIAKAQTTGNLPTNTTFWMPAGAGTNTDDATAEAIHIMPGYTAYAKGNKLTGSLPSYSSPSTVTPTTSATTLPTRGKYCTTNISVNATTGVSTSDATAAATDILTGKTAYVKGNKVTGTLSLASYTGALTVNPSTVKQSLPTANKLLTSNIVVNESALIMAPTVSVSSNKLTVNFARKPLVFLIRFKTSANAYVLTWCNGSTNVLQTTNSGGVHAYSTVTWSGNQAIITLKNESNGTFAAAVSIVSCFGA